VPVSDEPANCQILDEFIHPCSNRPRALAQIL
jgi:hypothetical protein